MDRIRGCNGRELRLGMQLGVRRMAGDRRSMVLRGREGEGWGVQAGKIPVRGLATLGIYNPPLAISLHLEFAFQTAKSKTVRLFVSSDSLCACVVQWPLLGWVLSIAINP